MKVKTSLLVLAISLPILLLAACDSQPVEVKYRGQVMGTSWSVKLNSEFGYDAELDKAIQAELDLVDARMSNWKSDSDISRFNDSELNTCTEVSTPTLAVVLFAQRAFNLSDGAFDISLGPLIDLWGFGAEETIEDSAPSASDIEAALELTGIDNLYLTDTALCKRNTPVYINVSGLAKGYGVDRVASLLSDKNFDNYLVEVGGELRAKGINGRDQVWSVGIERPDDRLVASQVVTAVKLGDAALATSGDYRNFYALDDQRYSHIIDPKTGYPVTHNLASVTVRASTSIEADAWATALLVAGPEKGMALAEKKNLAVLMVRRNEHGFDVSTSSNW